MMWTPYEILLEQSSELDWDKTFFMTQPWWLSFDIDDWWTQFTNADDRINAEILHGCLDAPLPELTEFGFFIQQWNRQQTRKMNLPKERLYELEVRGY